LATNLDRYQADLDSLIRNGAALLNAIQKECYPDEFAATLKREMGDQSEKLKEIVTAIPDFSSAYQAWYSESKAVIKLLLPDRLSDFVRHYEKPKNRKDISFENYSIEDALQGLQITRGFQKEVIVDSSAAIPHVRQQLEILKSVRARFKSSLFDIRQLVAADLFDSELDAARELARKKFTRAAGAVAGVVLEKHLQQVCDNHVITVKKSDAGISHLNDLLKAQGVIDVPQWRAIQHLGDLRNLCDHPKGQEPSPAQIGDLIDGVAKVTKTIF
jgi:hypothetical protein